MHRQKEVIFVNYGNSGKFLDILQFWNFSGKFGVSVNLGDFFNRSTHFKCVRQ